MPAEAADSVAGHLFGSTGRGVALEETDEGILIVAHIEPDRSDEVLRDLSVLLKNMQNLGILKRPASVSAAEEPEEDWMAVFRAQHDVIRVSDRLTVRPTWCEPAGEGDLLIDPGLAFGTGSHATTYLCLVLLDSAVGNPPPPTMLDLGTGTGVLAIASIRLGVPRAVAVDIDPTAVEVARENAELNSVSDRLELVSGGVGDIRGSFPLVTANLSTYTLMQEAARIAELVAPEGTLIVSGILEEEMEEILAVFGSRGLRKKDLLSEGTWSAASLVRPAAG